MKGTHWTGLILSIGMGCATEEAVEMTESSRSATNVTEQDADEADGTSEANNEDAGSGTGSDANDDTDDPGDGGLDDGGSDDESADSNDAGELVLPPGLNGVRVTPPVPLVDFYAVNRDGTSRSMEDLVDGPTVIWFYPAADTYG